MVSRWGISLIQVLKLQYSKSPTEYDFVGGIFDAALVEYRPKSPVFAPAALRGTRFGLESRAVGRKIFAKSGSFWSTPWDY